MTNWHFKIIWQDHNYKKKETKIDKCLFDPFQIQSYHHYSMTKKISFQIKINLKPMKSI